MNSTINCSICEKNMDSFLDNELIGEHLFYFLDHIEQCPNCYEELETKYLLSEALTRLENGETINLKGELKHKLSVAMRIFKIHNFFEMMCLSLETIGSVIVAFEVVDMLFRYI